MVFRGLRLSSRSLMCGLPVQVLEPKQAEGFLDFRRGERERERKQKERERERKKKDRERERDGEREREQDSESRVLWRSRSSLAQPARAVLSKALVLPQLTS